MCLQPAREVAPRCNRSRFRLIFAVVLPLLLTVPVNGIAQSYNFSFGIIAQPDRIGPSAPPLREALESSGREQLEFVVLTGIKSSAEPCSDQLYETRKQMINAVEHDVFVSAAAGDWAECRREDGGSAARERLVRLRDIFFTGTTSGGKGQLPLKRQSSYPEFRVYSENMRWHVGGVVFGTLNVPGNNNHYVPDAGRNSEFEDRMVANRAWLQRLLHAATTKKARLLVLFIDGDPRLSAQARRDDSGTRDGYRELRRHLRELVAQYSGRVLLVHQSADRGERSRLDWRGKFGELVLAPGSGWVKAEVNGRSGTVTVSAGAQ